MNPLFNRPHHKEKVIDDMRAVPMTIIQRLEEISRRLNHLDEQALWIAKETVNVDAAISQSSTLICALAADLQEKLADIIAEIESDADEVDDVTPYH